MDTDLLGQDEADSQVPPTVYVITFHPSAPRESLEFLLERVEGRQRYGGGELFVRGEPQTAGEGLVVHISATKIKLLEIAEAIGVRKPTTDGLVQELSVRALDHFLPTGASLDTLLTPAEQQICVRHQLDALVAREETHIPGSPGLPLYLGQGLVDEYIKHDIITSIYPLHDRLELEEVAKSWYKSIFATHSMDKLRNYFGDAIALYFGFLTTYSLMLLLPAVLGLAHYGLGVTASSEHAFCALFNIVWVTVFLEVWKRHCSSLTYQWGSHQCETLHRARPSYHGKLRLNPVTGAVEPHYPLWRTQCKVYLVSVPLVGLHVLGALYLMVMSFWAEEFLIDWKKSHGAIIGALLPVPTALYTMAVWVGNRHFRKMATKLTEWENHRTQHKHEWHRMAKLVVFELVNNFSSLFYIAFYIQNMDMLRSQMATMLIVTQMINHFQEALLPLFVMKFYCKVQEVVHQRLKAYPALHRLLGALDTDTQAPKSCEDLLPSPVLLLEGDDPRIRQARKERKLAAYEDTYGDYMELLVQFAMVSLFSAVYPPAALWALLNNVLELKADAAKLCLLFRRPEARRAATIGVWQGCFEAVGWLSVVTNCGLLAMSPSLRSLAPGMSTPVWLLLWLLIEHSILLIKVTIMHVVPDCPAAVRQALEKAEHLSRAALNQEREKNSHRQLHRRYRSVHGMPRSGSRSRGASPVERTENGSFVKNGGVRHRRD